MAEPQVFDASMVATNTLTSGTDLGGVYEQVYLKIPTMASNADIFVHGSLDNSSFYRITQPVPNTSSVQVNDFKIASNTTSRIVPIPAGFRYMKLELSTLNTLAIGFEIIAQRKF
jgi:hypothetical protein